MAIYVIMLFQTLVASGTHIVAKTTLASVDPATLTLLRSLIAGGVLAAVALAAGRSLDVEPGDRGRFLLLSALGVPVNQFFFLAGLAASKPTNAALFYGATPALVLLLSAVLRKERPTPLRYAGVAVAFAGILVVVFERGLSLGAETVAGDLLLLGAVVAWTFYTVLGKDMILKYGPVRATTVTLVWGTAMFVPFGALPAAGFGYAGVPASAWWGILYLAIGTSVVAYLLWYYALGRLAPSKVAIFANIQPVFTMLLAWLLLGEVLTPRFLVGAGVTLAGVVMTEAG